MTPSRQLAIGVFLTALAGFVDAMGFIQLQGFYVSFMSGNTTQLGQGLALGLTDIELPALLVALFFTGSVLGTALAIRVKRRARIAILAFIIVVEALALTAVLVGAPPDRAIIAIALAMGAQNAAIPAMGAARLGATFVTGTLFAVAQDLVRALHGEAPPWRWLQHGAVWLALMLGAVAGGLMHFYWGMMALLVPLVAHTILATALALQKSR